MVPKGRLPTSRLPEDVLLMGRLLEPVDMRLARRRPEDMLLTGKLSDGGLSADSTPDGLPVGKRPKISSPEG